jgi:methylenetetrahydrofolate dehydrogenase (NADP+)/methenyltetrahydrofolate cyclohydrolase
MNRQFYKPFLVPRLFPRIRWAIDVRFQKKISRDFMTLLLKAEPVVNSVSKKLQERCSELKIRGILPKMAVFLVGDNASSQIYVQHKQRKCREVGAACEVIQLPESVSKSEFLAKVEEKNLDNSVHGIIIQLPLPSSLKVEVNSLIVSHKDIDGFGPTAIFKLFQGVDPDDFLAPCTPKGVMKLLRYYQIPVAGKKVCIVGRSHIVGKPQSLMMLNADATVCICHSKTKDLKEMIRNSDIIVAAIGKAGFLTSDFFRDDKSQVVVDVGIHKIADRKLIGDVEFDRVQHQVKAITPVPGGVGPMTVLTLIENLILAASCR